MAAPNLKSPTTITGKSVAYAPTTTIGAALSNAANSNQVLKVNSIFCASISAGGADITVSRYDGTTDAYIAFTLAVPAKATQVLCSTQTYFYLEEGQSIRALASANSTLQLVIGYEVIA